MCLQAYVDSEGKNVSSGICGQWRQKCVFRHMWTAEAKMCLQAYVDSGGKNVFSGICGQRRQKCVCRHMWAAETQMCRLIRAFAVPNRIIGHYKLYQWRANTEMRLCMHGLNLILCILHMLDNFFALCGPNNGLL